MWSEVSSNYCDHYGSLEFEIYWAKRGCSVTLFHYIRPFKKNICSVPEGKMADHPNINIVRGNMWEGMCYNCFYNLAKKHLLHVDRIDIMKIQGRDGVNEDFDGIQYSVLSDLYWKLPALIDKVQQIALTVSLNTRTLTDNVGRESSHAWNMWATQRLLRDFGAFRISAEPGPRALQPQQYAYLLHQAKLDANIGGYKVSFRRLEDETALAAQNRQFEAWQPAPVEFAIRGVPPEYCSAKTPAQGMPASAKWPYKCSENTMLL